MTEDPETPKTQLNLTFVGIVYFFLFVIAVWIDRVQGIFLFPAKGEERGAILLRDVGIGLIAGLLVVGLTYVLLRFRKEFQVLAAELHRVLGDLKTHEVFFISAFSSVSEEFFFRGFVQAKLGLIPASLLFGLLHMGPDRRYLPWTVFAIVMGFAMGWLYSYTQNLFVPVVMHFTINFINLKTLGRWANQLQKDET